MDKDQLKHQRDILQRQKGMERMMLSESLAEMVKFVENLTPDDGLVCPPKDKKNNPWAERAKCVVI